MNGEARKLNLIEVLLKEEDENVLSGIESLLLRNGFKPAEKKFADFAGTLTNEQADEWMKNIEDGCEQIYPDDWK